MHSTASDGKGEMAAHLSSEQLIQGLYVHSSDQQASATSNY